MSKETVYLYGGRLKQLVRRRTALSQRAHDVKATSTLITRRDVVDLVFESTLLWRRRKSGRFNAVGLITAGHCRATAGQPQT